MVTINDIPVYNAVIDGDDDGMMRVSLVDYPAVLTDFQAFDEAKHPMKFAVKDEEKRLVYGVLMRADFPIYRYDMGRGEYYIVYKADVIRKMAEKYLAENRQNNVNLMHEDGTMVNDVQMVQMFIKDTDKGVNPVGFDDIADGSLFAEYHVENDEVWNAIKDGTYRGFSLEGYFGLEAEKDQDRMDDIADRLKGKFSKFIKTKGMSKVKSILSSLAKALLEMGSTTTDKGVISWEGDEDLKVGDKVTIVSNDEEGNEVSTPAEDGEYKTEDGKVIVVADGVVTEIKDAEAEVAPEAEPEADVEAEEAPEAEPEDEVKADEAEDIAKLREDVDGLRKEMDEAYKLIDKLLDAVGLTRDEADTESKMSAQIAEIKASVEALAKTPQAEPAHEAFNKEAKGDGSRVGRIVSAMRK